MINNLRFKNKQTNLFPTPFPIPQTLKLNPLFLNQEKDLKKFLKKQNTHDEISIVYFGTSEFSAYILEKLILFTQNPPQNLALHPGGASVNFRRYSIQAVVTNPDKPAGRKKVNRQSPVALVALKYNLLTLKPTKLDKEFMENHFTLLEAEIFIVVAYGQILLADYLKIPTLGGINVHGSLLPKYRGASPIQSSILNGDKVTGITIMLMDEKLDHGPILFTKKISISDKDTYENLSKKMSQEAAEVLPKVLDDFVTGKIKLLVQDHAIASYCTRIKKESGYFNIDNPLPPEKLDRMIRAYYPWPGVWTLWNGKVVKFLPPSSHPDPANAGEGSILIQMEGKQKTKLKDFLNGYPDFPIKEI